MTTEEYTPYKPEEHYKDLLPLIMNIIEHTIEHGNFIKIDNRMRALQFVWKCTKTQKLWAINLVAVRKCRWDPNTSDPRYAIIIDAIRDAINNGGTSETWQLRLIQDPVITHQIKKMGNLKAFW